MPRVRATLPSLQTPSLDSARTTKQRITSTNSQERVAVSPPFDGGCACGQVRYRLHDIPLFVHCCHCTRCQRETGSPFAHHAMIEFNQFTIIAGEPHYKLVPTDSGGKHWVARCPHCQCAMWNEHGTRKAITRYVRVGTLDNPDAFPPLAHIYVRSKQAWVVLDASVASYRGAYDASKTWPESSVARYAIAKQVRAAEAKIASAEKKPAAKSKR